MTPAGRRAACRGAGVGRRRSGAAVAGEVRRREVERRRRQGAVRKGGVEAPWRRGRRMGLGGPIWALQAGGGEGGGAPHGRTWLAAAVLSGVSGRVRPR